MKKIIALLLLICTFALCLVSCASMDKYEDNLSKDYDIEIPDDDDMLNMAFKDITHLDAEDYEIENLLYADHNEENYVVYILECKTSSKAKELAKDLEKLIEEYDSNYTDVVRKGKFVFWGYEKAINDALGK